MWGRKQSKLNNGGGVEPAPEGGCTWIIPERVRTINDLNEFFEELKERQGMSFYVMDITFEMPTIIDNGINDNTIFNIFKQSKVEGTMNITIKYERTI